MKRTNLLTLCLTVLVSTTAYSMDNEAELPFANLNPEEVRQALQAQRMQPIANQRIADRPNRPLTPLVVRPALRQISLSQANSPAGSRGNTPVMMPINEGAEGTPRAATPVAPLRAPTPGTPTQVPAAVRNQADAIFAAQQANQLTQEQALQQLRALLRGGIPTSRSQSQNQTPQDPNRN